MLVRESVTQLGYHESPDHELCLVRFTAQGKPRNTTHIGNARVDVPDALYLATATFQPGTIQATRGRSKENIREIYDLAFDFDLKDYLDVDGPEDVWRLPRTDLNRCLDDLDADVLRIMGELNIPVTRMLHTGYGTLVLARLRTEDRQKVSEVIALHKSLVRAINDAYGGTFADPGVNDGGTRIVRLPGSRNTKGRAVGAADHTVEMVCDDGPELDLTRHTIPAVLDVVRRQPILGNAPELPLDAELRVALADVLRPVWTPGKRHNLAVGMAGLLAKAGITEGDTGDFVESVAIEAGDEEWAKRRNDATTTYRRLGTAQEVSGYRILLDVLDEPVVSFLDAQLEGVRRQGMRKVAPLPGRVAPPVAEAVPPLALRGWFGSYVNLMHPCTEACQAFHLAVAFTLVGAWFGRRLKIKDVLPLYPNFYTVLVGDTGRGKKTTAIEKGLRMLGAPMSDPEGRISHTPPFRVVTGLSSREGLVAELAAHPQLVAFEDEFSSTLSKGRQEATSTLFPALTYLYNSPHEFASLTKPNRSGDYPVATNPFLSLIGGIPEETLRRHMTGDDAASGFANRILFVFGNNAERPIPNPPAPDERIMREMMAALRAVRLPPIMGFSLGAESQWEAWYGTEDIEGFWHRRYELEVERQMVQRLPVTIRKLAGLYAATEGNHVIDTDQLDAAIAFAEWLTERTLRSVGGWGGSDDAMLYEKIERMVIEKPRFKGEIVGTLSRLYGAVDVVRMLDGMFHGGCVDIDKDGVVSKL